MVFHREARRRHGPHVSRAGIDVENALTLPALEVVMVRAVRQLVPRVFARQVHQADIAVFQQRLEVAVDRGDAQTGC
jgi:hypothetical protein